MSIKEDLKALAQLQTHELEVVRIAGEIAAIDENRTASRAQIATAEAVVKRAEQDVVDARAAAKRFDIDLKAAEEKVSQFKDQMHVVKTNEQLWAVQAEISHAEGEVGSVETQILEQLEVADSLTVVIDERKAEMVGEKKRIDTEVAAADKEEAELVAQRAKLEAAMSALTEQVPADLMRRYDSIKALRGGIGVAEVLDETCLACNTKVRPQHYVDTFNVVEVMQCENCKRIVYVAESVGLAAPVPTGSGAAEKAAAAAASAPETAVEATAAPAPDESEAADVVS